jgi:hypothetical protein
MHKELILKAFKKAKEELEIKTGVIVSKQKLSQHISYHLFENYKCQFGDKSLRVLFKNATEEKKVSVKQFEVVEGLCKFIGYKNYVDFNTENLKKKEILLSRNKRISIKGSFFKIFKKWRFPKISMSFKVSIKL